MIDESTDKSSTKHLAIVSRMVQSSNFEVKDEFVKLIEVSDASAKGVYDAIIHFFNTHDIPYKHNLAGFASDGANVMFGNKHSVKTLLEQDVPHLFVIKCLCHSLALCASYACEKLPNDVENLVNEVYNYMKFSSKRQKQFQEFQEFLDMKPYKLLQPSQTRWLALHACVKRMVDLYKSIKLYFQAEHLLDNKATTIYQKLSNPINELYLHFLNFILPILTNLNIEFQSQKPKIHYIYSNMERTYKTILESYMKYDYIKNTDTPHIQYRNPSNFLPLDKLYLGAHCMAELSKNLLSKTDKDIFLTNCLNFLVECCHQFYKRFPFNSKYVQSLKNLGFLDPKNMNIISISHAASDFHIILGLDLNELDSEWRMLRHTEINKSDDAVEFWRAVKLLKKGAWLASCYLNYPMKN
ncbi:E3 SUMO-protein ligase KIAA1586-like [Aphis gossypii]|uniref:E3 SUMO-protein ligase KIAA1586-like n=1 Tax=Aphis gossypii TaxID=80765 RepID=UPI002159A12B|nr:E3 SUMO-protein ligase KIAA1586-like [Aphis gossypii]